MANMEIDAGGRGEKRAPSQELNPFVNAVPHRGSGTHPSTPKTFHRTGDPLSETRLETPPKTERPADASRQVVPAELLSAPAFRPLQKPASGDIGDVLKAILANQEQQREEQHQASAALFTVVGGHTQALHQQDTLLNYVADQAQSAKDAAREVSTQLQETDRSVKILGDNVQGLNARLLAVELDSRKGSASTAVSHQSARSAEGDDPWMQFRMNAVSQEPQHKGAGRGKFPGLTVRSPEDATQTIVMGSWAKDTPRDVIHRDIQKILDAFPPEVKPFVSRFNCPSVRCTYAWLVLDGPSNVLRTRAFAVMRAVRETTRNSDAMAGKPWASFPKTPEERALAGWVARVRRCLTALGGTPDRIECDHKRGIVWIGDTRLPKDPSTFMSRITPHSTKNLSRRSLESPLRPCCPHGPLRPVHADPMLSLPRRSRGAVG